MDQIRRKRRRRGKQMVKTSRLNNFIAFTVRVKKLSSQWSRYIE